MSQPTTSPLSDTQRIDNYWRQNGHTKGLTPKQRRRAEHKAGRTFYRELVDENPAQVKP